MISPIEYNSAWSKTRLQSPKIWYTWKILEPYVRKAQKRLEIGVGMFPKFTIQDTYFLDTSEHAIAELNKRGGKGVVMGAEGSFPFQKNFFDLIGAFEVLEHLEKPEAALRSVASSLKPEGLFILSVPMGSRHWSSWDVFAGHVQRFGPTQLDDLLKKEGFKVMHCYVSLKLAQRRSFSWLMSLAGFLPLRFPNLFFALYDYALPFYTWFGRMFSRSHHYNSLLRIPQDFTNALVICRKQASS